MSKVLCNNYANFASNRPKGDCPWRTDAAA